MDRVILTQGQYAIVDSDLFPQIASLNWRVCPGLHGTEARRSIRNRDGSKSTRRLKNYVLELRGVPVPPGSTVEFKNGNSLDCRTENLRVVKKETSWV
jgi:hypothetical protein